MAEFPEKSPAHRAAARPKTMSCGLCRSDCILLRAALSSNQAYGPKPRRCKRPAPEHFHESLANLENFRGEAKLSTWLYKIAINESISHLERERRRLTLSLDDEQSHLAHTIEADEHIDGDALAQRLRRAVATLPEKQRLVFNMKYYDDMKYEDISEILGTSVGALKASYHVAIKKIEQFFSNTD